MRAGCDNSRGEVGKGGGAQHHIVQQYSAALQHSKTRQGRARQGKARQGREVYKEEGGERKEEGGVKKIRCDKTR
jgi:hypothetical protein